MPLCKREAISLVGKFDSYDSIGHITLIERDLEKDKVLVQRCGRLKAHLKYIPSIELNINQFDRFKNDDNYVLYVKIEVDEYVEKWFKAIGMVLGRRRKITPHITIAKSLSDDQFTTLWKHFQQKDYQRKIAVDAVRLLIKKSGKHYNTDLALGGKIKLIEKEPTLFD